MTKRTAWRVGALASAGLLAGCHMSGTHLGQGADPADPSAAAAGTCLGGAAAAPLAHAKLPAGFCAWAWAQGLSAPRGEYVASNGDVLVVESGAAKVTALYDDDHDGVSGPSERVTLASAPGLNHGIAVSGGSLYASSSTAVYRWPYHDGDRTALGAPQTVVTGLPGGGHTTRTLAFGPSGDLYVSEGSGSNVDADSSRARIWRFSASQLSGPLPVGVGAALLFADGLRNEVGLAFDAQGRLWGVENGRDDLSRADLGGDIHDDNPGEEVNLFADAGKFYGYPYCWSEFQLPPGVGMGPGTQWADPGTMNDGTHTDAWCRSNGMPPQFVMPAHTAPLDIMFYSGGAFPAEWSGDALVALHGSWDRDPPQGYEVVRLRFSGGVPVALEPLLEHDGPAQTSPEWPHRPVNVKQGPEGEVYVTSDNSNTVIAVSYAAP